MIDQHSKSTNEYLDCIAGSASEKADIIAYVDQLRSGKILEIGPGAGTALAEIVRCVERSFPPNERPEIVVFDLIADIFDRVKETVGSTDVKIEYIVGDGSTNLPFEDSSVSAVNLSAVAHECFSYGGGYSGIHRLAKECGRIMQLNGILTYRDPDGIELHSMEEARLTTALARVFVAFFLPKFVDRTHSRLKNKVELGYEETLKINVNGNPTPLSDIINIEPASLEESEITIHAKTGLIHEIQRHLVTFTKDLGSLVGREDVTTLSDLLRDNVTFEITNPNAIQAIIDFLTANCINFKNNGSSFKLTVSAFNLVHSKIQAIAHDLNAELKISDDMQRVMNWGTSEGEENYFYGSSEEVVARFAHFSLIKDGSGEIGYSCLCPISVYHIRTVDRDLHTQFLKENVQRDTQNALSDKKRHIHFAKMPVEKAFPILLDYYRTTKHPALLETLQALMFILNEFSGVQADRSEFELAPGKEVQNCVDLCANVVGREDIDKGIVTIRSVFVAPHLGLIGGIASGKSTAGDIFKQHGYQVVSFSDFIKDELHSHGIMKPTRDDYFGMANQMRRDNSRDILARLAIQKVVMGGIDRFVLDGMRNSEEIDLLRKFVRDFVLIGVETDTEERIRRVQLRMRNIDHTERQRILGDIDREFFDPSPDGCRLSQVMSMADVYVNGNLTLEENRTFIENLKLPNPTNI